MQLCVGVGGRGGRSGCIGMRKCGSDGRHAGFVMNCSGGRSGGNAMGSIDIVRTRWCSDISRTERRYWSDFIRRVNIKRRRGKAMNVLRSGCCRRIGLDGGVWGSM